MAGDRLMAPGGPNAALSGKRIAYHEAGHAVVQALVARGRFRVAEVSIKPGVRDGDPYSRGHALLSGEEQLSLYEFGLVTMAGIAAENRYFEDHPPSDEELQWGAVSDIEEWETACGAVYPDPARARLVGINIMRKLQMIFDDPAVWMVLRQLAATLEERETVTEEELRHVLAGLPGAVP